MTPAMGRTAVVALGLLAAIGLTGDGKSRDRIGEPSASSPPPALSLVSFDDCHDLLAGLRTATKASAGRLHPGRLPLGQDLAAAAGAGAAVAPKGEIAPNAEAAARSDRQDAGYSRTNTRESDVDEPDVVKTDGTRIISISGHILRIVDVASGRLIGSLDLDASGGPGGSLGRDLVAGGVSGTGLLLSGNHALVLIAGGLGADAVAERIAPPTGPVLILVDLKDEPRVAATYRIEGALVDARQNGTTARVVVRSSPRFAVPADSGIARDSQRDLNQVIDATGIDGWLPRYVSVSGQHREVGRPACRDVRRPSEFSGLSLLTILTFDLNADQLGNGQPISVVADGDTVYATKTSLYLADNQRWWYAPAVSRAAPEATTALYQFSLPANRSPVFAAAGKVPGWLLNQYSLSEWEGHLRVATTQASQSTSATVYVLRPVGDQLSIVGSVGGLGRNERIYAVRFIGPLGFVVTFRQTDPLYSVDLRDPRQPRVLGELELTGYSAYLHPVDDQLLIGIGQEADNQGRTTGTQVSLFSVGDPEHPRRLARHQVPGGRSAAESDPHAVLYWRQTRTLVIPVLAGALVLTLEAGGFRELGTVHHPEPSPRGSGGGTAISRSLVAGGMLWTLSNSGLAAHDLRSLAERHWVPW